VVTITTPDTAVASEEIRRVMHLEPTQVDGTLLVEVPDSASFMPRLFSELSVPITAVSARRPSLDDVFLKLTGRAIREQGTRRWIRCETWAGYGELGADERTGTDRSDRSAGTRGEHSRRHHACNLHHLEARPHPLLA